MLSLRCLIWALWLLILRVTPSIALESVFSHDIAASSDELNRHVFTETLELKLCDCEPARGSPYGLSCEKQGYFISEFERTGQWLAGGGLVPLSRAVCCRPCLPKELPEAFSLNSHDNTTTAVAIVSIGCHKSDATGAQQLQCDSAGSLVVGYAEANRVSAALDAYYPVGAAQCCTPSVLLSNGDAWELEHCDCEASDTINCGGKSSNRMLAGFQHWRMTFATQYVPIAPANCCKACLTGPVHRMDTCADLNMCSGRGVCILGQCECLGGWNGADCSRRPSGPGSNKDLPNWLVALIVSGACVGISILLALVGRVLRYYDILPRPDTASEADDSAAEPLLAGLDDEVGSVGSEDTTDCDSDTEQQIAEVAAATQEAGEAGERAADTVNQVRLESVERLILDSHRHYPDNMDAGIEYAMREMEAIISEAEHGNAAAVAEAMRAVEEPLVETIRATYRAEMTRAGHISEAGSAVAHDVINPAADDHSISEAIVSSPVSTGLGTAGGDIVAAARDSGGIVPQPAPEPPDEQTTHTSIEIQAAEPEGQVEAQDAEDMAIDATDAEAAASKARRKAQLVQEGQRQEQASGPLACLDCSVCLSRPIQVVVIPCGHACMCRRCSRRLQRCPICRREVVRRQRLFVGG